MNMVMCYLLDAKKIMKMLKADLPAKTIKQFVNPEIVKLNNSLSSNGIEFHISEADSDNFWSDETWLDTAIEETGNLLYITKELLGESNAKQAD